MTKDEEDRLKKLKEAAEKAAIVTGFGEAKNVSFLMFSHFAAARHAARIVAKLGYGGKGDVWELFFDKSGGMVGSDHGVKIHKYELPVAGTSHQWRAYYVQMPLTHEQAVELFPELNEKKRISRRDDNENIQPVLMHLRAGAGRSVT